MTDTNGDGRPDNDWRLPNGFTLTIHPAQDIATPPNGCLRITGYGHRADLAIAGDEAATVGNYVSVLFDCFVNPGTPAHAPQPRTVCNLVLDDSAVIPLIKTLALAGGTEELVAALNEQWQTPTPGRHNGPGEQVDWAARNGASGRRPLELPPLNSGQSRLILMEPEFEIVGDKRLANDDGWISIAALRPLWTAEDGVAVQLEEVNLCLSSAGPHIALLLHAIGQPELAAIANPHMGRANRIEPQEPPEANERGLIERVREAIQEARDQGNLRPRNEAVQEPERDEAPPPNAPIDDAGSEHVIGVAALVDAVMELNHDTPNPRRREYLLARIEIIAMEIGAVDDRFNLFQALLSPDLFSTQFGSPLPPDFSTLKLPGIEDPPQVAGPYLEVEQRAHSLDAAMRDLRDEILELRREWLTSTLLKVEPALEYRTTTEARLQARGLPSRP